MRMTALGSTGLQVTKNAFGALPIQRLTLDEAVQLLRSAYDAGMNFFDTARVYSDSEEKIGHAFRGMRQQLIIASKTPSLTEPEIRSDVETSLRMLQTDYIDILQLHNPVEVPLADSEAYNTLLALRREGKILHIGITNHRLANANIAIDSGLYAVLQFPLSALSSSEELQMAERAGKHSMGVLCMKAMCGGLLKSARYSMAVLDRLPHAVPIYGVQRQSELDEIIALDANPPILDETLQQAINAERESLGKNFCRGCGYCQPCPIGLDLQNIMRMPLLLERSVWQDFTTPEQIEGMRNIQNCLHCNLCKSRCPYALDIPAVLERNLVYYEGFLAEKNIAGA